MSRLDDGLRFAFGTLTVLRVRVTRWDRSAAGSGMLAAPVVGLVVGIASAALGVALLRLGGGPLLAAVGTVAVPAVLTRGLHLDGLADTADALGSGRPADGALRVMKASDIGPFGVLTLVLAVLAQVAAVAELFRRGEATGVTAVLLAAVVSRAALPPACRRGVAAARPQGLGAVVAGSVPRPAAGAVVAVVLAGAAALGGVGGGLADGLDAWGGPAPTGGGGFGSWPAGAARCAGAAVAGLAVGELLLRRCRRRFGGITGDVLGAVVETVAVTTVLALAVA